MANEKQQSGLMFNALTAGSKIVGSITADSDFRIDGMIEGDLNCSGKSSLVRQAVSKVRSCARTQRFLVC